MTGTNGTNSNGKSNGAFPELVIDMGTVAAPTGATATSSLAQTVENALREVLAWRPRATDPKGFVAALEQVFTGREVEGRIEFSWTPRSYAVQADMGAVTGAQASIYARAKAALDQILPLLEGLYPLRSDKDDEDVDAIRALVRAQVTELVAELGMVGGPRLPRVDTYFDTLLIGPATSRSTNPKDVGGLLGRLRGKFGLEPYQVNTIEEEQNLTNFFIIVDQVSALQQSWQTYRPYFARTSADVFLGTQLVLISRLLGVVAESVQEMYFKMDSVFLGAAERETLRLPLGDQRALTIAELLSWLEHFANDEGPRIIREAGKEGVIALAPTIEQLVELVNQAYDIAAKDPGQYSLPGSFHTSRVRQGWTELSTHVTNLADRMNEIQRDSRPANNKLSITAINPGVIQSGE